MPHALLLALLAAAATSTSVKPREGPGVTSAKPKCGKKDHPDECAALADLAASAGLKGPTRVHRHSALSFAATHINSPYKSGRCAVL